MIASLQPTMNNEDALYRNWLNALIANTLEKVQPLDPEAYGMWYTRLYSASGREQDWNVRTLRTLEQLLIDLISEGEEEEGPGWGLYGWDGDE